MVKKQVVSATNDRITIRHVAIDAGVSVAAVSKVLRNAYGVSDILRTKVEASIEKLNYRPSVAARAMRGKTKTIGILIIGLTNPFLANIIESANLSFVDQGYRTLIGIGRSVSSIETSMIEAMIDNRMDGVLIIAPRTFDRVLEKFARQIPIAVIAHHEPLSRTFDTINSNDRLGAAVAVEALVGKGYQDVVMLCYDFHDSPPTVVALQREHGYLEAMKELGLEPHILRLPPVATDRQEALEALLMSVDRPRAVFVWSDLDAVPLINMARSKGIRVPEDIAIIGYDNSPMAALPLVGLSSIDQNPEAMGSQAAETLLSRIDGRTTASHLLIEPHLKIRPSF